MDKLTIFIALTGVAVALQAGVLLAMFIVMRSTASKMEALANEMKSKVLPIVDQAQTVIAKTSPIIEQTQAIVTDLRPTIEQVSLNVKETTMLVKGQIERTDATVNDVIDRARLQVIRADELLTRTMDRVEHTSDVVQKTVMSPVRQVSGLMHGITAGLEYFFANRSQRNGGRRERRPIPQDEMFI